MAAIKQPADQSHFILPDLGEGVHEAEIISWKVKPGEAVKEHQTIAEMETDKALVEVPSPWTGVVSELCGSEGEIINVGNILVKYDIGGGSSAASEQPAETSATEKSDGGDGEGGHARAVGRGRGEIANNRAKFGGRGGSDGGSNIHRGRCHCHCLPWWRYMPKAGRQ